jgi:hypothetical protein
MSEDIDLKIVANNQATRGNLRKLRSDITDALLGAGFVFDPTNPKHRVTMYEGRYTLYQLPYQAIAKGEGVLRPEIQIETSVSPRRVTERSSSTKRHIEWRRIDCGNSGKRPDHVPILLDKSRARQPKMLLNLNQLFEGYRSSASSALP